MTIKNQDQLNVLGEKIEVCSCQPMTGWFRDGFCKYDQNDGGNHSICCVMNNNFLKYSKSQGNDLITPMPIYSFPLYSSTFFKEMLVFFYY